MRRSRAESAQQNARNRAVHQSSSSALRMLLGAVLAVLCISNSPYDVVRAGVGVNSVVCLSLQLWLGSSRCFAESF